MESIQVRNDVWVVIYLFGEPENEMAGHDDSSQGIRELAIVLGHKLAAVAEAVERLEGDGWAINIDGRQLEARHPEIHTRQAAAERLRRLEIDDDLIDDISEWNAEGRVVTPA